jgi:hypothetical protein
MGTLLILLRNLSLSAHWRTSLIKSSILFSGPETTSKVSSWKDPTKLANTFLIQEHILLRLEENFETSHLCLDLVWKSSKSLLLLMLLARTKVALRLPDTCSKTSSITKSASYYTRFLLIIKLNLVSRSGLDLSVLLFRLLSTQLMRFMSTSFNLLQTFSLTSSDYLTLPIGKE